MKKKSLIIKSLATLLVLIILSVLLITFIISTQAGLRLATSIALPYLPGISIGEIKGRLIGPIEINSVVYKTEEIELNLDNAQIDWRPSDLLFSTLTLDYLRASQLSFAQISAPQTKEQAEKKPLSIDDILQQLQLPLSLNVNEINITHIKIDTEYYKNSEIDEKKAPIIISEAAIKLNSDSEKIKISNLRLDSNIAKINGQMTLGLKKNSNTRGEITWSFNLPKLNSVNGNTELLGNTKELMINSTIQAPYSTEVAIKINDIVGSPSASAKININSVDLSNINSDWPRYLFIGNIDLKGNMDQADISSQLAIKAPLFDSNTFQDVTVTSKAKWANKELAIDIDTRAPSLVESLTINGNIKPERINSSDEEAIKLQLKWNDINKPALSDNIKRSDEPIRLQSPSGEMVFSGNLNRYQFELLSSIKTGEEKNKQGNITLAGKGSQETLSIKTIRLTGPIGSIDGDADLTLKPELQVQANLSGDSLDPEVFSADWPGKLNLNLNINTIKNSRNKFQINADLSSNGELRGKPFSLSAKASYDEKFAQLNDLNITSNKSVLSLSATLTDNKTIDAQWKLNSENLGELFPEAEGKIVSDGSITSLPIKAKRIADFRPKILATIKGNAISIANVSINSVNSNIDLDWNSVRSSKNSALLNITDVNINTNRINSVVLNFTGTPEKHQLSSEINSNNGDLSIALEGEFKEVNDIASWFFNVNDATLSPEDLNSWTLSKKSSGKINFAQQELKQFCLTTTTQTSSPSEFCLDILRDQKITDLRFDLDKLPADYFKAILPENFTWTSSQLSGNGVISIASSGSLDTHIELISSEGELNWLQTAKTTNPSNSVTKQDSTRHNLILEPSRLLVKTDNNQLKLNLDLPLENKNGLKIFLDIDNSPAASQQAFANRKLNGMIDFRLDDLSPISTHIADATEIEGSLKSQWNISGSPSEPTLNGKFSLQDAKIALLTPGITLENISLTAQSSGNNQLDYNASAESGGGSIESKGKIILHSTGPEINATITGNNFQLANTPEVLAYASPNLNFSFNNNISHVEGSLTIPKATISPKTLPASVITSSSDEIIIDTSQNNSDSNPQTISASIQLILGDEVNIDGFGFKGKTRGKILVRKTIDGNTTGNGKINIVDGEYRAFGQGLVIDKGDIIFSDGPIEKPGIDIKASRRPAEGITVGVFARGSISKPELNIFSEPAMTQSEQLSWLVLGRPLEQSSEGESNALNQLLLSLTLSRSDSFLSSLSDTFNLDTLSIKTGSGEAGAASDNNLAELVLGKYLSPELYVSYGIGLFKPVNVFSLEYSLNKNWKLISESSSESSSGDLIYTFER